ncbi:MAG TPA: protease inhibitor I42 family protein [Methanospirillum sp.]|nr:protease inhibitor I42 family protein [Methanospirillum sp.]
MEPRFKISRMRMIIFILLLVLVIVGFAAILSATSVTHTQAAEKKTDNLANPTGIIPGEGKKTDNWTNPAGIIPGEGKKPENWINPAGIKPGEGNNGTNRDNPEIYSNSSLIHMQLGETSVITLPENPSTGYQWDITVTDGLRILNDVYEPGSNPSPQMGGGGDHSWTINTLQEGKQVFSGIYRRSWEPVSGNESVFSQEYIVTRNPVIAPIQPVIPTITRDSSGIGQSHLTISASTTSPTVGEEVAITGRLTDQNGAGIGGATVTMDESGYSGPDPLTTTQTDSDGRFEFTVGVSYAYTVGMLAHYPGDESHPSADSNTIMFDAHS